MEIDLNNKKVLIIRPDAIGDCISVLPMVNAIKKKWPYAKVYMLVSKYTMPIFQDMPSVDGIILDLLKKGKDFFKYYKFYSQIKKEKFDLVIHSFNVISYSFLTWLARIPIRIGDKKKIGPNIFHNYKAIQKFNDLTHHEVELNMDLLEPLGIKIQDIDIDLHVPDTSEVNKSLMNIFNNDEKKICIHIGTGGGNRPWDIEGYIELAKKIIDGNYGKIVIIGNGLKEQEMSEYILSKTNNNIANLVNKTNIRELIWIINKCSIFIGVDSGPMHIASALRIPIVAIAATNYVKPTRWGPYGTNNVIVRPDALCKKPCFPYKCKDNYCTKSISVDKVFNSFLILLNQKDKNTTYQNMYLWLKSSLNILLILDDTNEKELFYKTVEYLSQDNWCFVLLIVKNKLNFFSLYNLVIQNDINLIHYFGKEHKIFFKILSLLSALRQYLPPKLLINNYRDVKDISELIDNYINILRT